MKLREHFEKSGFSNLKLPWQMEGNGYRIVLVQDADSLDHEIYSITNIRYDSVSFRGRLTSPADFDRIFMLVKEDYDLSEHEEEKLKNLPIPYRTPMTWQEITICSKQFMN